MEHYLIKSESHITIANSKLPLKQNRGTIICKNELSDDICGMADKINLLQSIDEEMDKYIADAFNTPHANGYTERYNMLVDNVKSFHPFFDYEYWTRENYAERYVVDELYERMVKCMNKKIYFFISSKEYLDRDKDALSLREKTKDFFKEEKAMTNGHSCREIEEYWTDMLNGYDKIKMEFKAEIFSAFYKIFYPYFEQFKLSQETVGRKKYEEIICCFGKRIDKLLIGEEFSELYNRLNLCFEEDWINKMKEKILKDNLKEDKGYQESTSVRRIKKAIEDYATVIPDANDVRRNISISQNYFYYLHTHRYMDKFLRNVQSYTQPVLLYEYLYSYPNEDSPVYRIMTTDEASGELGQHKKEYEKAFQLNNIHDLEYAKGEFLKAADLYLPKDFDFFKSEVYEFQTFEQIVYLELYFFMAERMYLKKCVFCHKHFMVRDARRRYCDNCRSSNPYPSQMNYQNKRKEMPASKRYKQEYDRYSTRIGREKNPEKEKVLRRAREKLRELRSLSKQCDRDEILLEQFLQQINNLRGETEKKLKKYNK